MSLENPNIESDRNLQNAYTILDRGDRYRNNERKNDGDLNADEMSELKYTKPLSVMDELRAAKASGDTAWIDRAQSAADQKYSVHNVKKWTSHAADFVPVIGSAKMVYESMRGTQVGTGTSISGWQRAVHGATGAAFLAADLTGVGALGSIAGKALARGGVKVGERMMTKAGEEAVINTASRQTAEEYMQGAASTELSKLAMRGDARVQKSEQISQN